MKRLQLIIILLALLVAGCDSVDSGEEEAALDDRLEALLVDSAPDGEQGYFRFPAPGDYASIPQDPRNPITPEKVALGRLLFHETALAVDTRRAEGRFTYSCASCHHAAAGFQAGVRQGIGEGGLGFGRAGEARLFDPDYAPEELDVQPIRSPSILGVAYQELMLWNGQFGVTGPNEGTQSQWAPGSPREVNFLGYRGVETQAIAGLGIHRMGSLGTTILTTHPEYVALWEATFPGDPIDPIRAGLALAAYQRTVFPDLAPFQSWLAGNRAAMTASQKRGAILFFGRAGCVACHTGPALNSMTFHALGMGELSGPDTRFDPRELPEPLGRGEFTRRPEDEYTFKTPQLYNLADAVWLGHGATFSGVRAVLEYKNRAVPEAAVPADRLSPLFVPLGLSETELDDLTAFVERALRDPDLGRYVPSHLPSGRCFPVNDGPARIDLGCD